ncbi:MAG: tRNA isopentenyl-2-thiomethyl-A-37 hydroxylase MiaE [Candidatus Sericytochromatia bacterium]|nr:tRNA isopentenyl-2-thiomethyl-A-37 hydroxylase MiaE [Candidatus Sericytochromatia bacterium]
MTAVVSSHWQGLGLSGPSRSSWITAAVQELPSLLADHAACERKAAATAMAFVARHPDDPRLVESMLQLAQEELVHFERLFHLMRRRGWALVRDQADPYVRSLLDLVRPAQIHQKVDRLLVLGLVEARSCERFRLLAEALVDLDPELAALYAELALSEEGHAHLFEALAARYAGETEVRDRLSELRTVEAALVAGLADRPAMHG